MHQREGCAEVAYADVLWKPFFWRFSQKVMLLAACSRVGPARVRQHCLELFSKRDYSNELGDSSFEFHSFIAVLRLFPAKVIPQSVEEEYCGVLSEQWRKRSMLWYRRAVFLFFVQATLMSLSAVWFCTDQPRRTHVAETGVKYCSSIEERCARLGPGSGLACDTPG